MSTERKPGPATAEYARIKAEQLRGSRDNGSRTTTGPVPIHPPAPPPAPTTWRQSAVTWGMLGLVLVALYAGWQGLRTVRNDLRTDRATAISGHDQRAASHPDIRAAVTAAAQRIERRAQERHAEVTKRLDRISTILAQPAKRRRRR